MLNHKANELISLGVDVVAQVTQNAIVLSVSIDVRVGVIGMLLGQEMVVPSHSGTRVMRRTNV